MIPSPILHLDCDRGTGHRTVMDLIQAGKVISYPCTSFEAAETVYWAIKRGQIAMPGLIVVDTVSKLAEVKRQDTTVDASTRARLESGAATISSLGEAVVSSQRDYGVVGDHMIRLLGLIIALPCPSIFVVHQSERDDPMSGMIKKTPDLQRQILRCVIADADAIVALALTRSPYTMNGAVVPAGARQLLLDATLDTAIGVRSSVPLPPFILRPTLETFIETLGGELPHNTVLYGPFKIGKTAFACGADRNLALSQVG